MEYNININGKSVRYNFSAEGFLPNQIALPANTIVICDECLPPLYPDFFKAFKTIPLKAREADKTLDSLQQLVQQLIHAEAHKSTFILVVGGGIITDMGGFAASVYMRGLDFAFMPTTLLAMVDAAIGGKNGVNVGLHKNMLGTINQPTALFYSLPFLNTLALDEWSNGFAEIIKYACMFSRKEFDFLLQHDLAYYRNNPMALQLLIIKCVDWKNAIVIKDEKEKGDRKLLNFGHTLGHAIEQLYPMPHGRAVAVGMAFALFLSCRVLGTKEALMPLLQQALVQYGLPTKQKMDANEVLALMNMDKKRKNDAIEFILLKDFGEPVIMPLRLTEIAPALNQFIDASHS
jgi:3-dehydroquinate synthase